MSAYEHQRYEFRPPLKGSGATLVATAIARYGDGFVTEMDGDDLTRERGDLYRLIQIVKEA